MTRQISEIPKNGARIFRTLSQSWSYEDSWVKSCGMLWVNDIPPFSLTSQSWIFFSRRDKTKPLSDLRLKTFPKWDIERTIPIVGTCFGQRDVGNEFLDGRLW